MLFCCKSSDERKDESDKRHSSPENSDSSSEKRKEKYRPYRYRPILMFMKHDNVCLPKYQSLISPQRDRKESYQYCFADLTSLSISYDLHICC